MIRVLAFSPFGFDVPFPVIVLGTIIGLTYGLLAVGLLLIYRSNRVINFAHGEIGAFAAAMFGLATGRWNLPYYVALPLALAVGAGVAALAEVAIVRRLRNAPRLMSIVATLGVGQFLLVLSAVLATTQSGFLFPQPPGVPEFHIGTLRVTQAYSGMLLFAPVVVFAITLFLRRSRFGLAIRSAAANPEAARMAGIFAGRMSSLSWAIAGGVSAFTAILVFPSRGVSGSESFGPSLLMRALAGAVIARMNSLPAALAAGVGLGVIEQLLLWNYPRAGLVEVALFVTILVALLVQRGVGGREDEKGSWAAVQTFRPLPDAVRQIWAVRHLGMIAAVALVVVAAIANVVVSNATAITLVGMMGFAIIGLSVGIITGLGGQLSLGQFALGGIGATVSFYVSSRTGNFALALLYAGLATAAASLVIGLPALRVRGLFLTVTTLGFALATPAWLLQQPWMLGAGVDPGRPIIAGTPLDTGKRYYWFALAVLMVCLLIARNARRGGFGRLLVAVRDNEDNARAFTIPASTVKIQGFLLAGFLAGVGGAVFGHTLSRIGITAFPTTSSIDVVVMSVIGGVSVLAGPLIGAFYVIGIPEFLPLDSAGLAATRLGALLLILYLPAGLAQLVDPLRRRIAYGLARRAGVDPDADVDETAAATAEMSSVRAAIVRDDTTVRQRPPGVVLLRAENLRKRFGGVAAVQDVSLEVRAGETFGLIGPNGAGKTTLFEILGGFTRPDSGTVRFDGRDVSDLGPEARGRLGLIRSFQDAALFSTMTVQECVQLALEKRDPTGFIRSTLGVFGPERKKEVLARELIGFMGLDRYRTKQIQELSTGTRRITELACLIALEPVLLLLDEPSSGIAQRESEALGALLSDIKTQLQATLLIIEHDIPLIMSLSDRILAMDAGHPICEGTPEMVRNDERVVEAYLGGSVAAIERSGVAAMANEALGRSS